MRMRAGWCCLALSAVFAATSPPAAGAPKPISGTLAKTGYTVIALAPNGKATSVRAGLEKFRLRPPARRTTLHLRAPNGSYAGPVVVGRQKRGRRAILGVRAEAKLGEIRIRTGYAKLAQTLPEEWIDPRRVARARRGVPIGAGVFGRVRSSGLPAAAPGDLDHDGVPDLLDIDDDGDLTLDNVDRSQSARARVAQSETGFNIRSVLAVPMWETANANAAALTDAHIDSTLTTWGRQILEILPGGVAELDCGGEPDPANPSGWSGGLVYCTRGGSGTVVSNAPPQEWAAFPECCDDDGDGFGTLVSEPSAPGSAFFLAPGATAAQIGTGDVLIQRVTGVGEFTVLLPFIFATTPALVAYNDGQGNAATITYPIAGPNPGPSQGGGGPGTDDDPFPVKAGPDGEVLVALTFWRPQRRPIAPESGDWTDIGGLTYSASAQIGSGGACPQSAFSEDDPNLTPADSDVPYGPGAGGLRDQVPDQPASPANTLTYVLNLTQCLRGQPWSAGEAMSFNFGAVDSAEGNVSVTETVPAVTFELQP